MMRTALTSLSCWDWGRRDASVSISGVGLRVLDKLAEFARFISQLPHPPVAPQSVPSKDTSYEAVSTPLDGLRPEDKTLPDDHKISPQKRMLLSGFGFFERAIICWGPL